MWVEVELLALLSKILLVTFTAMYRTNGYIFPDRPSVKVKLLIQLNDPVIFKSPI